jgi:hypothetical protein
MVVYEQRSKTIPYRHLDRTPGRLSGGKEEKEEYQPEVETLREMGSDIRKENGADEPLYAPFQINLAKFRCSMLGAFRLQKVKYGSLESHVGKELLHRHCDMRRNSLLDTLID